MGITVETGNRLNTNEGAQLQYTDGHWQPVAAVLPEETAFSLFLNGQEFVTIQCTPEKLNCLVAGFLKSEGLITSLDDITMMRICQDELMADVCLKQPVSFPRRRILTSGCGGGQSFDPGKELTPVKSALRLSPPQILAPMNLLLQAETDMASGRKRGVHLSAISDGEKLLATAEDIGRHNTIDKILGECLLSKIPTADKILFTTGRISSEMLIKSAKMQVPVVASLNSATGQAVMLGKKLGITIVGYVRGSRFTLFCGSERINQIV